MITIPMFFWALILALAIFSGIFYWYGWKAGVCPQTCMKFMLLYHVLYQFVSALTILTTLVTVCGSGAYFWLKNDKVIGQLKS